MGWEVLALQHEMCLICSVQSLSRRRDKAQSGLSRLLLTLSGIGDVLVFLRGWQSFYTVFLSFLHLLLHFPLNISAVMFPCAVVLKGIHS